jgi:hypothetical protein
MELESNVSSNKTTLNMPPERQQKRLTSVENSKEEMQYLRNSTHVWMLRIISRKMSLIISACLGVNRRTVLTFTYVKGYPI